MGRPPFVRMDPRSPDEEHRSATPLELFFDLVFVVAIARASGELHHGIADGHLADAALNYCLVFFGIWWAWMNFSWFASAYDTDDVPYRVTVFVQLTGALIFAAGVPAVFEGNDWTVGVVGYVVMRVAMVTQWLRAARDHPEGRPTAIRYAIGVAVCQAGWVAYLLIEPSRWLATFVALAAAELAVPVWAERFGGTTWHRDHMVERYGLFTIIVLGESILAASLAVEAATSDGAVLADVWPVAVGGLLIVLSTWWLYFARPEHRLRDSFVGAFAWGYGHLVIYAAIAAVGAGIAVAVDHRLDQAEIDAVTAGAVVTVPVAITQMMLWAMHVRRQHGFVRQAQAPLFALLILATPWVTTEPVLATGVLLSVLLAVKLRVLHGGVRPRSAS